MMIPNFPRALLIVLVAASVSTACGDESPTTPTTPTDPTLLRSSETFSARLGVGESQFYSFSVSGAGTTDVTLVSVRTAGVPTATLTTVVGLGLGTPAGTDCALSSATNTAAALTKQLSETTNAGVHCVKISDVGNLPGAVDYTLRIFYP